MGDRREDLTARARRFWPLYHYLIVYDPETQPITVVRILHGMRVVEQILH